MCNSSRLQYFFTYHKWSFVLGLRSRYNYGMSIIYAFGDSIAYGAWDVESSGWATRLRREVDERQERDSSLYFLFYNLGIPGETTRGLVSRFENEFEARAKKDGGEEIIFLLAYGANDLAMNQPDNKFRVSEEEFTANLSSVLEKALKITSKIILLNILPFIEEKNDGSDGRTRRTNENVRKYNSLLDHMAKKYSLKLVDLNSLFMNNNYPSLICADDGIHPNAKGHELIAKSVIQVL